MWLITLLLPNTPTRAPRAHAQVCRGFRYYQEAASDWLGPPKYHDSCAGFYSKEPPRERRFTDNEWHHVAAVWTAANNGTAKIYKDGAWRGCCVSCAKQLRAGEQLH